MTILRTNTIAGIGETFGPLFDGDFEFNSQNYVILPKGTASQSGVLRDITDVVGAGRTFYDNLVLAMPFNAATGLTDVSSRNRNPAAYGNVSISSTISKYYGSSAKFDGNGDYLRVSNGISDFQFGSGDFTIETWFWKSANGVNNYDGIASLGVSGSANDGWFLEVSATRGYIFAVGGGGIVSYNVSPNTSQWIHLSVCKQGNTTTMYLNGVSVSSFTGTYTVPSTATTLDIGTYSVNYWFNGFLQDLRVYKGIAKYTANFTPPDRIAEVGVGFKSGALRYNTDSSKVELYDGSQWTEVQSSRPDLNGGARGVFGGGYAAPLKKSKIDYINISSTGDAIDFGDLTNPTQSLYGASSNTRAVFAGGYVGPTTVNVMEFVTISSTGTITNFGERIYKTANNSGGCSNQTRGIFNGGQLHPFTPVNTIDYITIASTGTSVSFGILTAQSTNQASCASPVRGVFAGGYAPGTPHNEQLIEFVTISTLGNSQSFGNLTASQNIRMGGCSNSTRGLFGGGQPRSNTAIDLITIASLGNAIDFGDLTLGRVFLTATSSPTRAVFAGGSNGPYSGVDNIDYITIATQGNAVDFGNLTVARGRLKGLSNAHGGL